MSVIYKEVAYIYFMMIYFRQSGKHHQDRNVQKRTLVHTDSVWKNLISHIKNT